MNVQGIGVSLVGNFSEKQVPKEQLEALVFLVNTLRKHYGIPVDRIIRHGDVPGKNTECPGLHFPWGHFKQRLLSVS
jgi:N-acetylmuramoyl-L-alanine amidase